MTIGEKIKYFRKNAELSQEQLAQKLLVSRAAVAKWESDHGVPDIENLKKLAEVFVTSIDELVSDLPVNNSKRNVTDEEFYSTYLGKKCNVEMVDWNDGVFDSYLINQDERFLYYVTIDKKCKKAGALAKQYIEEITLCSKREKQTEDISGLPNIDKNYFIGTSVDIYLEEKNFLSGLIGKDTELLNVGILEMYEDYVKPVWGKDIELKEITKIETSME